jgi:hypothetical protein
MIPLGLLLSIAALPVADVLIVADVVILAAEPFPPRVEAGRRVVKKARHQVRKAAKRVWLVPETSFV